MKEKEQEKIVLGGGCFWCLEAVFEIVPGIEEVTVGYSGGKSINPTYQEVCQGKSAHAEVIEIKFSPQKISLEEILELFWLMHDPTTLNQQGADKGTQYRSVIFADNLEQLKVCEQSKSTLEKKKYYSQPVLTEIRLLDHFYQAEEEHQNYYQKNPNQPYCQLVIQPKISKLLSLIKK